MLPMSRARRTNMSHRSRGGNIVVEQVVVSLRSSFLSARVSEWDDSGGPVFFVTSALACSPLCDSLPPCLFASRHSSWCVFFCSSRVHEHVHYLLPSGNCSRSRDGGSNRLLWKSLVTMPGCSRMSVLLYIFPPCVVEVSVGVDEFCYF